MADAESAGRAVSQSESRSVPPIGGIARLVRGVSSRLGDRRASQTELLEILHDVADAVTAVSDVDQVLELVAQSAKRITGADKAIVVLFDEDEGGIDPDTLVVRGRRDQHEQEWWEFRLEQLGHEDAITSNPILEEHPQHHALLLCYPAVVKGAPVGLLCAVNDIARPFTELEQYSLAILAAFAASSIESARLAEQNRYTFLASERDRIAREMHDGVVQSLFSISLGMEVCKKQVNRDPAAVAERLDTLQLHLNSAMTELRRFIYDLRPVKLAELGLLGAIEFWVNEITMGRAIKGQVVIRSPLPRLSPSEEAVLYGAAKEAVSNAVRHASAHGVTVYVEGSPEVVTLRIVDDGSGFDIMNAWDLNASGIGIDSIRQRVEAEGGMFRLESAQGRGTTVTVQLPVAGGPR